MNRYVSGRASMSEANPEAHRRLSSCQKRAAALARLLRTTAMAAECRRVRGWARRETTLRVYRHGQKAAAASAQRTAGGGCAATEFNEISDRQGKEMAGRGVYMGRGLVFVQLYMPPIIQRGAGRQRHWALPLPVATAIIQGGSSGSHTLSATSFTTVSAASPPGATTMRS